MKKPQFFRLSAHFLSVVGLVFLGMLPRNKYEWMQQPEASGAALPNDAGSGERQIVAIMVLLFIAILQAWLLDHSETTRQRLFPLTVLTFSALMLLGKWL